MYPNSGWCRRCVAISSLLAILLLPKAAAGDAASLNRCSQPTEAYLAGDYPATIAALLSDSDASTDPVARLLLAHAYLATNRN